MPNRTARARIERISVIRRRNEHDAAGNDRRNLHVADVPDMEHPLRLQVAHIARRDLIESRESLPGVVTVIREPVFAGLREHRLRGYIDRRRYDGAGLIVRSAIRAYGPQGQCKSTNR